ncbi:uncharacterized protein LOC124593517 [Schistocerca americana]|uniref:uncharacterized protein LOC124545558 n=1 Tax=Schistocerca americana TaxID=7009 RepID=UPI001F4F1B17|nr:uncharacterized protein LOC124545558 [Schistocerca americana]XP_046987157.1 uncharacterized protein LOC124576070 [Schistocerca americana]XP_046987199.1 uncharacterized protein LOC124579502 [Schistocerca americana]XP_046987890.1 uncharacterized protein LOC124593517 [Schistocerca americana]
MPSETDARAERSAPEAANALPTAPADRAASLYANGVELSTSVSLPSVSDSTPPPTSVDRAHAYRVTRESETVISISRECCASLQQPLETPVDAPTAQQDSDEALQLLVSLMPHAAAAPLGVDSDNDEEEMQTEQTPAGSQASTSRASRKRQKSDDDSSAPDTRKFRKEYAQNGTKAGTKTLRRTPKSKVDNDGFVTATKTAKATRQPTAAPVGTSNSFLALSDSEDEELTLPPPQQRRALPPLIVKFDGHFRELQNALNLLIGKDSYTISATGDDLHKVKVKTTEHFVKVSEECTRRGWNFYTFSSNRKKPLKVVFRKIPRTMKPEELKEDLEQMGYCVEEVIRMKLHRTKGRNPLFLVIANNTAENRKLFQLKRIGNLEVCAEVLRNKAAYAQCYRCLELGHSTKYCGMPEYCVKCEVAQNTKRLRLAPAETKRSSEEFQREHRTHVEPQRTATARQRGNAAVEAAHPAEHIPRRSSTSPSSAGTPTPGTKSGSHPAGGRRTRHQQRSAMADRLRPPPHSRYKHAITQHRPQPTRPQARLPRHSAPRQWRPSRRQFPRLRPYLGKQLLPPRLAVTERTNQRRPSRTGPAWPTSPNRDGAGSGQSPASSLLQQPTPTAASSPAETRPRATAILSGPDKMAYTPSAMMSAPDKMATASTVSLTRCN